MSFRQRLGGQGGFTLAEIIVALMILAIALIPMAGMFDTAVKGMISSGRIKNSKDCAAAALEQISAMPFYQAYNADIGDVDIDDHFWGNRTPIYSSPVTGEGAPDWEATPQVLAKDYNATPVFNEMGSLDHYRDYKVTVGLAYLDDNVGAVAMNSSWGPKLSGKDKPLAEDNSNPHLLLIHIEVSYQANGIDNAYILEQIVTDTQAIYGVGIHEIQAKGPNENLPEENQDPNNTGNIAMHWPDNNVNVKIGGWGFDPSTVQAWLVRNKYADIEINLSSKSEETLEGTVNLYSTGTADVLGDIDVFPRAGIGYWTVKIQQEGIINAYLFNGFIVSFPKPQISDFYNGITPGGGKTGANGETAQVITVQGGPFPYKKTGGTLIWNPNVSLVPVPGNNSERIIGTVTNITGGNNGYAASPGCTITATFDLTKGQPGLYYMQVWNTDTAQVGHIGSKTYDEDPGQPTYEIVEVPPIVTDVYVSGTAHQTNVYKGTGGGTVRLEIIGNYPRGTSLCKGVSLSLGSRGGPAARRHSDRRLGGGGQRYRYYRRFFTGRFGAGSLQRVCREPGCLTSVRLYNRSDSEDKCDRLHR